MQDDNDIEMKLKFHDKNFFSFLFHHHCQKNIETVIHKQIELTMQGFQILYSNIQNQGSQPKAEERTK